MKLKLLRLVIISKTKDEKLNVCDWTLCKIENNESPIIAFGGNLGLIYVLDLSKLIFKSMIEL
jgi:hypothetical protein